MASEFNAMHRFPDGESAMQYLRDHGQRDHFKAAADQGEFILIALPPKADAPKAAKAKPAKAEGKKGRGGLQARMQKQDAEKKAAKAKADLPKPDFKAEGKWHKPDDRKWIGNWAALRAAADAGRLPNAGPAKPDLAASKMEDWGQDAREAFGGIFAALTHWPFRKRISALAALIRAKDEKGLKLLAIKEISTSPIMLGKLRDLAIAALAAKAEKPAKPAKAKAPPQADGAALEGPPAQA